MKLWIQFVPAVLVVFFSMGAKSLAATSPLTIRAAVDRLSQVLASERERKDGSLRYREASVIEALLYRTAMIQKAAEENKPFEFSFSKNRQVRFNPSLQTLKYHAPLIDVSVRIVSEQLEATVIRRNLLGKTISNQTTSFDVDGITEESLLDWEKSLNQLVRKSRGFKDNALLDPMIGLNQTKTDPSAIQPTEILLDVKEKWVEGSDFDRSPWIYSPVKLVSWPLQKLFYDLPAMVTGLATESVTRSPWHNLLGAWDELRGAWKLIRNAGRDLVNGILDPTTARTLDGTLELMDASMKIGNSILGIAKAGISTIAYPIYRKAGGKKSQRVAIRGKRAVIVLIDSALNSDFATGMIDTYGEEIIRSRLKSIADYYCVRSGAQDNDMDACIRGIPANIQYLDVVSLQHSGGGDEAEEFMKKAVAMKNVKPELLLSIGCYDEPSRFVETENSMGQERSSWAVHYYLANMLEKRLRGMSTVDASQLAYGESFVSNAIDPVSWGAVLMIGTQMEDRIQDGYLGSRPSLMTPDSVVRKTIIDAEDEWDAFSWDYERRSNLRDFHTKVENLLAEGKIELKPKTLKILRESEKKLEAITKKAQGLASAG